MRHGKKNRKFGRETKQRRALIKSLAEALIVRERITTTQAKAKSLRVFSEKLVTMGKKGDLAAIRRARAQLNKEAADKLIKDIAPRFAQRAGGYTRIRNLAPRISDGAKMAIIEFV